METQPAEQRRRQQRNEARRAILDATEELLLEVGMDAFSIRRLAARCGYTAPTIYHHFGDKTGLIDAVLEQSYAIVLARMRRVRRGDDPSQYLRDLARAFVRLNLQNPTLYRLLQTPRPDSAVVPPSAERTAEMVLEALRDLARAGRLATDDLDAAFQTTWALLHGLVSLHIARPDYAWSRKLIDVALDAMRDGLVRAPTKRARASGARNAKRGGNGR